MKLEDFGPEGRFAVGRVVGAKHATYESLRTEPPSRYTQSDLIDQMLSAHKFAASERDRQLLRSISGLGTSRTREATITNLVDRQFLVEEKTKRSRSRVELRPTEAGMTIIANLPSMLTDPATTAKWELAFQMLEQGKAQLSDIQRYFASMLGDIVEEAKGKVGHLSIQAAAPKQAASSHFSKPTSKSQAGSAALAKSN